MITKLKICHLIRYNPNFGHPNVWKLCLCIVFSVFAWGTSYGQTITLSKTASNPTPDIEEVFNYVLDLSCSSSTGPCQGVVIRDTIPQYLQFLNFSSPLPSGVASATYDIVTREAVITFDNNVSAGSSIQLNIQVLFPDGTLDGSVALNTAYASSVNAGADVSSASATSQNGRTPGDFPDDKGGGTRQVTGGYQYWQIKVGNIGFTTIDNYSIVDTIPAGITLDQIRTPEFANVDHSGSLYYQRSDDPGVWHLWSGINLNNRQNHYVSGLGLPVGEYVSIVRLDLNTVPGTGIYNPYIYPDGFRSGWTLYAFETGGRVIGDTYTNCAYYTGTSGGSPISDVDCLTTTIEEPEDEVGGNGYTIGDDGNEQELFSIEDTMDVAIEFYSESNMGYDIVGGVMAVVLPPNVSYIPNSWYFDWGEDNADFQTPIVETSTLVDGRELVRFVFDSTHNNSFTIEPNPYWEGFRIVLSTFISPAAMQGSYDLEYYYYAAHSTHDNCNVNDVDNYLGGYSTYVCNENQSIDIVRPPGSAGLESRMEVIGTLDTDYSQYPERALTVPGGISDYKITIKNSNATRINRLVFVTVLPHIGDSEILDTGTPRFSEWQPSLAQAVTSLPSGLSVEYSIVSNPCRDDLAGSNPTPFPTGCATAGWSSTPPLDITDVTALRFDYGNTRLNQNDSLVVQFEMRSPVDALPDTSIAWNSFAYSARNFDDNIDLLPAEPIKVGIELRPGNTPILGDFVWEDLEPNGRQDIGEVGIDGVRVELYHDVNANGIAEPSGADTLELWTVTSAGGKYLFSDFDYGRYFLVFSDLPPGYNPTYQDAVNDTIDSDGLITPIKLFDNTIIDYHHDLGLYNGVLPVLYDISGTVYEDINYGGGNGRDYNTADISAVSSGWVSGDIAVDNVRIELYDNSGAFVAFTTTNASGQYTFSGIGAGNYSVRAVNGTVPSNRGSNATGQTIIPSQTYRHTGSVAVANEVGGFNPSLVDAVANTTSANISTLYTGSTTVQSLSNVTIGSSDVVGVDFGFNFDVIVNVNENGQGSLNQFVLNSNELDNTNLDQEDSPVGGVSFAKDPEWETSIFMIPGAGVHSISFGNAIEPIDDSKTHLTGYTQQGSAVGSNSGRTITVELDGQSGLNDGVGIAADSVHVSGMAIRSFLFNIDATLAAVEGIFIWGNYIGLEADGLTVDASNIGTGVYFRNIANSFIGTNGDAINDANEGNVVADSYDGLYIRQSSSINIAGNIVGMDKTGNVDLGSRYNGIYLLSSTGGSIVGFNDAAINTNVTDFRNYLSGGGNDGIRIVDSDDNTIAGNYMGTNISATAAIPNDNYGVQLQGTSSNNIIGTNSNGDDDILERNIISGNGSGIRFLGGGTGDNNVIAGNWIGTDITGLSPIANGHGLSMNGAYTNTVIGTNGDNVNDAIEGNVISGNNNDGIRVSDMIEMTVAGNKIGVGVDGTTPMGNGQRGVLLATSSSNIVIGYESTMLNSDELIVGNVIRYNSDSGVAVSGTGTQNRISRNQIADNGTLGIDLGYDSVTSNDNGDGDTGPNDLLNYPVLTSVILLNDNLLVRGFAPAGSTLEFFIADTGPSPSPLPAGYTASFGEGRLYLFEVTEGSALDTNTNIGDYNNDGTGVITTRTQSQFSFLVDVTGLGLTEGMSLSSTARDASGSTSEFSGVTELILDCGTATMNPHVMYFGRN